MSLFHLKKRDSETDWQEAAEKLKQSVVNFLSEIKITTYDGRILEKKLIFLLDDLRKAIKNNDPKWLNEFRTEIDQTCLDLYEEISNVKVPKGKNKHDFKK